MEKEKKITLCCIGLFAFLLSLYYAVAVIVSAHLFKQPIPSAETMGKYVVSRAADLVGLPWFRFDLPKEYEAEILAEAPELRRVHWRAYHYLLDGDNVPHIRFFYIVFPWYTAAAAGVSLAAYFVKIGEIKATPEAKRDDVFIRGVRRVDPVEFCKIIKKVVLDPIASVMTDGGELRFSANRLREHVAVFGASGTGKSQFLLAFLASFFANKTEETRCIIIDRKGEFWAHFGTPKDIIFNPFDARSMNWSLFNELEIPETFTAEPPDVRAAAKILFPERPNVDPFWQQAAADVFCSAVACCIRAGKATNKDLVNFCNSSASNIIEAFRDLPPGLAAGRVLGDGSASATTESILATLKVGIQPLAVCQDGGFSVKEWIHKGTGSLYLSSAGRNDIVFIPILTLLFDMIGREIKELPDNGSGGVKYLFVVDELAAYPKINTLHFLVAEARSKGVAVVIATQTIQKVLEVYGEKDGRDVLGNTKTKVIFCTIEAQDAEYLSKTIGASEIQRTQLSQNENGSSFWGRADERMGETKTKQVVTETVFLPGDLQTLGTGRAVVIHPSAGEAVSALQFAPFTEDKRGIEFEPVIEKTVSARDYAEIEKQRKAAKEKEIRESRKKRDEKRQFHAAPRIVKDKETVERREQTWKDSFKEKDKDKDDYLL